MTKQSAKTVMPIITVDSIDELHEYYTEKLGFRRMMGVVGKDGQFDFVSYDLGGAQIMFTRAMKAHHDQLKQRGVKITNPLTTQWWGDRTFTVMDPYGYQIWFYQKQVAEMKPPQGVKLV